MHIKIDVPTWHLNLWWVTILHLCHIGLGHAQCKQPIAITVTDRTSSSAMITWSDPNEAALGYEIELIKRGDVRKEIPNLPTVSDRTSTLTNLSHSTSYDIFVRTICTSNSKSKWTGPITFNTLLKVPTHCPIELPLKDNGTETFLIEVDHEGIIGRSIFIESVDFIVAHTWPSDLEILLESPRGDLMTLSENNGLLNDNYGNIYDTLCEQVTRVSPYSCNYFKDAKPPFIGNFIPDQFMHRYAENSPARGIWKLHFRDRSAKDVGTLKYLNIKFNEEICQPPDLTKATEISHDRFVLDWKFPEFCSNTIAYIIPQQGDTIIQYINCRESNQNIKTIYGLNPNTEYKYYTQNQCIDLNGNVSYSRPTCIKSVRTLCSPLSIEENFDDLQLCETSCFVDCKIQGHIFNDAPSSTNWIIHNGQTPTEGTGPDEDLSHTGNYIYLENSPELCGLKSVAILESQCLRVQSNGDACDLVFYYHMEGNQIGTLNVVISEDNGISWDTIFTLNGTQPNGWHKASVSLQNYDNKLCKIRFLAVGNGIRSDIAIDQIGFFGSTIATQDETTFFIDTDGDGFGSPTAIIQECSNEIEGYTQNSGDCDDTNPLIYPSQLEIQCNALDENCNGMSDDLASINPITYKLSTKKPTCLGIKDGEINLEVNGGSPPYTVHWSDNQSGTFRNQLAANIYIATITDATSCSRVTEYIDLQAETELNLIGNVVNPTCNGVANGSIILNHTQTHPPYTYTWSNLAKTKDLNNVPIGSYSVSVVDGKGCFASKSNIILSASTVINVSLISEKQPLCPNDSIGSVEILAVGGTNPYSYKWSDQSTNAILDSVKIGSYTVTVTDSAGCKSEKNFEIKAKENIEILLVSVDSPKCHNDRNGSIRTKIIGGSPPYTYNWNNFAYQTDDIFNLGSGNYSLVVTDKNGCKSSLKDAIYLKNPTPLVISVDSLKASTCILSTDGYVSIAASGGYPPISFDWNHIDTSISILTNITSGIYTVAAYDAALCKSNQLSASIPALNLDLEPSVQAIQDNKCPYDSIGSLVLKLDKGKAPFDINWSAGRQLFKNSGRDTIEHLIGGNYNVTVTDSEGCTGVSNTVAIQNLKPISYKVADLIFNACGEDKNGLIAVQVEGGTSPYNIHWNGGAYSGNLIFNLPTGEYLAKITDKNGCMDSIRPISLISKSNIELFSIINHASPLKDDGSICIDILGAVDPYSINWQGSNLDAKCIYLLKPGIYIVEILDGIGCMKIDTFQIERVNSTLNTILSNIVIYPNPAQNTVSLQRPNIGILTSAEIFNVQGKRLHVITPLEIETNTLDVTGLLPGVYILKIGIHFGTSLYTIEKHFIKLE